MLWAQCREWEENDIVITASWGTSESSPLSWQMFMFFPEKKWLTGLRDFTVLKLKNTTLSSVICSEATRKARHCVNGRWPGHPHLPLQRQCPKGRKCILLRGWTTRSSHWTTFHCNLGLHKMNYSPSDKYSPNECDLIKTSCHAAGTSFITTSKTLPSIYKWYDFGSSLLLHGKKSPLKKFFMI